MQIKQAETARQSGVAVYYYIFDLLYLDGYDTTGLALRQRKKLLRGALHFDDPLRFTPHRNTKGEAYYDQACRKGWEGIIAKRADSRYQHHRSRDWLKFKCSHRQEFVIGGYTDPQGERTGFGALLIGFFSTLSRDDTTQHNTTMTSVSFGPYAFDVSNPDKVLFPEDGITKSDLLGYYQDLADVMLPQLRDRPLMMHRYPDGIDAEGFYQKEIGDYFPDWIQRIEVSKVGGSTTHCVCNNVATLVYLANQGCITPHVWLSRTDRLRQPDAMIFDLDPPEGGDFAPVRFAARQLHALAGELELPTFVKTTGSRGVHVVVPLNRSSDFDEVRQFARDVAHLLASREPRRLTVEQRKDKRQGRLYLDCGRNAYAQTAVAPYAVRPLAGAPVATPLDWDELQDTQLDARSYRMDNIRRRLGQKPDPWHAMRRHAVGLEQPRKRLQELADRQRGD